MVSLPLREVSGMAFDVRAMENIATAPASRNDRTVAAWVACGILVAFIALVPFSGVQYAPTAAVVPAVLSAAILAQILTALLFYVQYRVARESQLALLSLAYASAAVLTLCYMLTFPQVFSPTGLLHASAQTAAWLTVFERENFGLFLIAFALADRFGWSTGRAQVRWIAGGVAVWVGLLVVTAIAAPLPELVAGGARDRVLQPYHPAAEHRDRAGRDADAGRERPAYGNAGLAARRGIVVFLPNDGDQRAFRNPVFAGLV